MSSGARTHHLQLPLDAQAVSELAVGDMVMLSGDVTISIGLPTHQRMVRDIEAGTPLPLDLTGGAFFHLSTYVRDAQGDIPARALYMNPSTSTRYNAYMPALIRGLGLRLVGGKGGLDVASVAALRDTGCAYLSFLGGGCTLLSQSIERVVSTHWNEYISQFRLTTLRVRDLGPATVAIDAHGRSIYDELRTQASDRLPAIMEQLKRRREAAQG
ncbi:fumarate hydratase C-terminal domain-containing protein [Hydrogenophaga sp.]|uniref:fumarate hydratase C-terminal domain-containing protein n=1 Tax=Hydrogenophaga sp. TaxID=1904254 RepID=UPI003D137063